MYGIGGERRLPEWEVPWLPGYEGSKPVRIGNAAYGQLQLDVFGEVMDALHQARCNGLAASESGWALQQAFLDAPRARCGRSRTKAFGRCAAARRHFTHSKVMAWVAFDRAIKSAEKFGLDGPLDHWREVCAAIHADVCRRGFDRELGSFVQAYGAKQLDASLLLLPAGRLSAAGRSARARHRAGDRAAPAGRRLRHALRHGSDRRRLAAGGGRVPRLQLLACRRLYPAEALAGRAAPVRPALGAAQRCRIAERGIRSAVPGGWSATFRKRSPMSRWSTARST